MPSLFIFGSVAILCLPEFLRLRKSRTCAWLLLGLVAVPVFYLVICSSVQLSPLLYWYTGGSESFVRTFYLMACMVVLVVLGLATRDDLRKQSKRLAEIESGLGDRFNSGAVRLLSVDWLMA